MIFVYNVCECMFICKVQTKKYFQQDDEFLVNRIATEKINKCEINHI